MMTNQREALDAAVREGMTHGTPGERAIIGLLAALLAEVTPPEAEPEPQVEEAAPRRFQAPLHEEVARDPSKWRDHPEPKAQERLRVVEGFGTDYDLLPSDVKSKYGSRFVYILSRAKSVDEGMGMVS